MDGNAKKAADDIDNVTKGETEATVIGDVANTTKTPEVSKVDKESVKNIESENETGVSNSENHDYREWEDCPVSGDYKLNPGGLRIAKVKDLKNIKPYMEDNNIKLIIDSKGKILPENAAGGFNYNTREIVLRDNPSFLSVKHEGYHAEQYIKLGKEKYLEQTVLEREEHVYNQIMKNKEHFNSSEILEAQRYIYKLRNGSWPPGDWKGFTE